MNRGKSRKDEIAISEGAIGQKVSKNYPYRVNELQYHVKKNSTSTNVAFEPQQTSSNKFPFEGESSIENYTNTMSNKNYVYQGLANSLTLKLSANDHQKMMKDHKKLTQSFSSYSNKPHIGGRKQQTKKVSSFVRSDDRQSFRAGSSTHNQNSSSSRFGGGVHR
jgi:hypothetical protein